MSEESSVSDQKNSEPQKDLNEKQDVPSNKVEKSLPKTDSEEPCSTRDNSGISEVKEDIKGVETKINKRKIRSEKQKECFKKCLEARKAITEERKLFMKEQREEQKRIKNEAFLNFRRRRDPNFKMPKVSKKRSLEILKEAAESAERNKSGITLSELENQSDSDSEEEKEEKKTDKKADITHKKDDEMDIDTDPNLLSRIEHLLQAVQKKQSREIEKNCIRGKKSRYHYEEHPGFTFL